MPLTSFDSSIQLRPCSGSSSIWRRSTLPATCDEVVSTSGVSPMTVSVSLTWRELHREAGWWRSGRPAARRRAARPSRSRRARPGPCICRAACCSRRYSPRSLVIADDLAARRLIGGRDADAGQHRLGFVDGGADDGGLLRIGRRSPRARPERREPRLRNLLTGEPPFKSAGLLRRLRPNG